MEQYDRTTAGEGQMRSTNKLKPEGIRYVPIVQVSFHTKEKCYRARGIVRGPDSPPDPTDQVLSVTTNKTMEAPAGTFNITLAGDGWFMPKDKPILKPNDLVVIYMGYKAENNVVEWVDGTKHTTSEDLDTVMIGLIDTVTRIRNGGGHNMQPQVNTIVTGRDFGKILVKSMLKFYPELGWDKSKEQKFFLTEQGWITLLKAFTNDNIIKGSPAKILDTAMRFILKKIVDIKWKVYDDDSSYKDLKPCSRDASLANILRYRFAKTNFFIPFFMSAQQYEGSIWNLMERVNLKPFTEMFIDTRDRWEVVNTASIPQLVNEVCEEDSSVAKSLLPEDQGRWERPAIMFGAKDGAQAVLVYRNTPFSKELWNKLRLNIIEYRDVIQENLSYSDNENYNLFWAGSTITPFKTLDLRRVTPPLINEENIKRYGLSAMEISVEGLQLDPAQESSQIIALEGLTKSLNSQLKDWFEHNSEFVSGTLVIRGRGSLKIGQRLYYRGMRYEFYVEAVSQNFQVYEDWQTTVQVTRGRLMPDPVAPKVSPLAAPKSQDALVSAAKQVATSTSTAKFHTVSGNDTLWSIAVKYYGNGDKWTDIWEANKTLLIARDSRNSTDQGHWLYSGQVLKIP